MEDGRDPSYTPFGKPRPLKPPDTRETLWTCRRDGVDWSCELLFRGESYGWEARVLRDRDLVLGHRFVMRGQTVEWSKTQKADIESGWLHF
jgi:hypothetical protein